MKISASLKSMLRQPIKTLLFTLLIALSSFAFAIRAFEGLIVNREITRLEGAYQAIGQLVPIEDWQWEIGADIRDLLSNSSLVHYTDSLQVIPGIMDDLYSLDSDGNSFYPNQLFVYGTLVDKGYREFESMTADLDPDEYKGFFTIFPFAPYLTLYYFDILVDTVEASLPYHVLGADRYLEYLQTRTNDAGEPRFTEEEIESRVENFQEVLRLYFVDYRGEQAHIFEQAQIGQRYFVGGQHGRIPLLSRAFRLPSWGANDLILLLHPLTEERMYFYPVAAGETVSDPEIIEQVEVLRQNIHTIFLRPTKNLTLAAETMNSMVLVDGRLIDDKDEANGNKVAVVHRNFAEFNELSVGDTITLNMRQQSFATEYVMPDVMRSFPIPRIGAKYDVETFRILSSEGIYSGTGVVSSPMYSYINNLLPAGGIYENHRFLYERAVCLSCLALYWRRFEFYALRGGPFLDGIVYDGIIHIDLRGMDEIMNLEMVTGYITSSESDQNWREAETKEVTLEIVGIYFKNDRLNNTLSVSTSHVFIPDSIVPTGWTQDVLYRHFSFFLNSPEDEEAFTLRYQRQLEEMGFFPIFLENDWASFAAATRPIQNGILMGVIAFTVLVLVVLYLTVFLYFAQRKREFAIARALGMKKPQAIWELSLPILLIGGVGLFLGMIPGWFLAIDLAESTLNTIEDALFEQPSLMWLGLAILLLFSLLVICSVMEIRKLAGLSELELLQGNVAAKIKKKRIKKAKPTRHQSLAVTDSLEEVSLNLSKLDVTMVKSRIGISYFIRVVTRNMIRRSMKSILSIAVPLGFLMALSWIAVSIRENTRQVNWLYDNTIVSGTLVVDPSSLTARSTSFPPHILSSILRIEFEEEDPTGDPERIPFVANYHAEARHNMRPVVITPEELEAGNITYDSIFGLVNTLGVSRLDLYKDFHEVSFEIEYIEGFNEQIFQESNADQPVILISSQIIDHLGVSPGDYLGLFCADILAPTLRQVSFYKVVGVFVAPDIDVQIITPLVHLQNHVPTTLEFDRAVFELNPELNRELGVFRQETARIVEDRVDPRLFFLLEDHILREVVVPLEQSITMMQTLYPILLALSGLIAVGLTALLLLPLMKEVAIMRSLGATRSYAVAMLILEQKTLCLLGLGLGAIISILAFGWANLLGAFLYLVGCLIAAIVFSILLVKRKPLDLLQVKE